ncbi:F420-0:Gamma-glutamyl ligase [Prochlorococcus sp. MIT 1307]|uniref:F420-0:Gamma-glutamyl ligase n=1 Tax=Prochlorococcus sp. MIT 1307 TaxID=3096219 RepID=UPI002A759328|nr:F420-0:Gamma-glutamyl ligase [Prochlorococcus sp. MIT 1307]
MSGILLLLIISGLFCGWLELSHRLRPFSPLNIKTFNWNVKKTLKGITVIGIIEIINPHRRMEIMVPEIQAIPLILGKEGVKNIRVKTSISPLHRDQEARKDGYWEAYIIKSKSNTQAYITISLEGNDPIEVIDSANNIWLDIKWVNYGPFGRLNRRNGFVIPLKRPDPLISETAYFKQFKNFQLLPLKTHLLGSLDIIEDVIITYVSKIAQPGDILAIGETPVAIMQSRYHHPSTVNPGSLSRLLCRGFHPTSSLATACGLQTLIDIVGPSRVLISFIIGLISKALGFKGLFYVLSGEQARLIDDITGTTPPYDQTIVLGPKSPKQLCEKLSSKLGIDVAIVDVNDLGRVKILAANRNCKKVFVKQALISNPAGNANEQTPLVLIRPYQ